MNQSLEDLVKGLQMLKEPESQQAFITDTSNIGSTTSTAGC